MPAICFYFQVHQPYRVKRFRVFDIGMTPDYFLHDEEDNLNNRRIFNKVAGKSYLPANATLLEMLERHPEFKISFSFSGTALEQMSEFSPEVLDSFKRLTDTGRAEVLSETSHHSLSFFYSPQEFEEQVNNHASLIKKHFGLVPKVFRNTELSYTNALGTWADKAGYKAILAEGWDPVLGWRSPNFVYAPPGTEQVRLLLKNYRLSDDIAFRFGERTWSEWPLKSERFAEWVNAANGGADTINLFMDYETFGEHQWASTGIFDFLKELPHQILRHPDNRFLTPSEVADAFPVRDRIDVPHVVTWADTERDLSAWTGNAMQRSALQAIYAIEGAVKERAKKDGDERLISIWRRLQTSDHFYYMCTKWFSDGDVHAYFNPYKSPYDAFMSYMNALRDFKEHSLVTNSDGG